jgi:hypothetical protein
MLFIAQIFMKRTINQVARIGSFVFIPLVISINTTSSQAENLIAQPVSHQYPKTFVDGFMNRCLQIASRRRLPADLANRVCNCTLTKVQAKYTVEQFKQLSQTTTEAIGFSCAKDILFEE